jgi:hypothetical protein
VDVDAGGDARVPPEAYFDQLNESMAAEPAWPPTDMSPLLALMAKYDTFPPPTP